MRETSRFNALSCLETSYLCLVVLESGLKVVGSGGDG